MRRAARRTRYHLPADAYLPGAACRRAPPVLGDEDELKAAVSNLIDNAVKYSGPRSQVAVRAGAQRDGAQARTCACATGRRHLPAELKRIFKRFYRVPGAVAAGQGHRPGLFIVRSVASGTAARCSRESDGRATAARSPCNCRQPPNVSRVLVVEDEQHLADGLRFNLEAEGYEVEVVDTGEAALERLLSARPAGIDLVVLDVMLPGKDGFAVVTELRAAGQFVPVLMLTARGRPEDVLQGFDAGADDYLPKPFELAILIARVDGLLRRSQWLQRSAAGSASRSPARRSISSRSSCASATGRCR